MRSQTWEAVWYLCECVHSGLDCMERDIVLCSWKVNQKAPTWNTNCHMTIQIFMNGSILMLCSYEELWTTVFIHRMHTIIFAAKDRGATLLWRHKRASCSYYTGLGRCPYCIPCSIEERKVATWRKGHKPYRKETSNSRLNVNCTGTSSCLLTYSLFRAVEYLKHVQQ